MCHGGCFTCDIRFCIHFRGWIFFYPLIYVKQQILMCELNNINTLQYPYPLLINLFLWRNRNLLGWWCRWW
jgi:hypothetical protein